MQTEYMYITINAGSFFLVLYATETLLPDFPSKQFIIS